MIIQLKPTNLLMTLVFLVCGTQSYGTAQLNDKIIYMGQEYILYSNPLEKYFEDFPDKRPNEVSSTSLWRGYLATYEIIDNSLYLKDIQALSMRNGELNWISVVDNIFSGSKEKVKLSWFSGILVIPFGESTNSTYMAYGNTFENYIVLEIQQGNITANKSLNENKFELFRKKQFEELLSKDEYKIIQDRIKKTFKVAPESIDRLVEGSILEYATKFY